MHFVAVNSKRGIDLDLIKHNNLFRVENRKISCETRGFNADDHK